MLEQNLKAAKQRLRAKLIISIAAAMVAFAVILPLTYFSHFIAWRVAPRLAADNVAVSITQGIGVALFNRVYVLGKQATLNFRAHGFVEQTVAVDFTEDQRHINIEMEVAPVSVVITAAPAHPQTRWSIDGGYTETADQLVTTLLPGQYTLEANNAFYRPETLAIEVQIGEEFTQQVDLTPLRGSITIESEPEAALVTIDGEKKGVTPVYLSAVAGGLYHIKTTLEGYAAIEEEVAVTNGLQDIARNYRLQLNQAEVRINASPAGGTLSVNGIVTKPVGALSLAVGEQHTIRYEKPGYLSQSQEVLLQSDEPLNIAFDLKKAVGEVVIRSTPPAEVRINGRAIGTTPQTLALPTTPQKVTLSRAGYRSVARSVTPRAATPQLVNEVLKTERDAKLAAATPLLTTAANIKMKFFDPSRGAKNRFTMGAPASEDGRRANEFQRAVELTKPFYVSTTEITQEQFAKYQSIQVTAKHYPVRNLAWLEAAGFCNWLSQQDGLQPVYTISNGRLQGFNPTAEGYRLLFEAEWEWLARVAGRPTKTRFVWGDQTTIPKNSGNFADESAKGSVAKHIPRYNDGFATVAPVATFPADTNGLFDLAGNVSEWVHDIYDLQPPEPGQVETNPVGGQYGEARVIKGANFRSASLTGLRASFREGLLQGRDDVGFRVARYVYGPDS